MVNIERKWTADIIMTVNDKIHGGTERVRNIYEQRVGKLIDLFNLNIINFKVQS